VFDTELLSILQEAKIFRDLSVDYIEMISTHGDILDFDRNDIIIEEGQAGHPLYIILDGQVEIFLPKKRKFYTKERPSKIKLNRLAQGDCIGEYSLIDDEPASASVVAVEPCKVFKMPREEFEKIITSGDHLAKIIYKNMLKVLVKRSRQYDNELDICY